MSDICIFIRTPEIYSEVLYRESHISRLEELVLVPVTLVSTAAGNMCALCWSTYF